MRIILTTILFLLLLQPLHAQTNDPPDPYSALYRSLAVPGWGHIYTGPENRTRGFVHLGIDLALAGSVAGFYLKSERLKDQFITLAQLKAGVSLDNRSRSFRLAVAQFDNLDEYNDHQLRSRNWNRLYDDTDQNRWEWLDEDDRAAYNSLRERADRARNQLPGLAGLLVLNRVVSAISAYNRARSESDAITMYFSPVHYGTSQNGISATLHYTF